MMEAIKQELLVLIGDYNQGRPVSYPAIDRKMMVRHPELVKSGQLGRVLDSMVVEKLLEQVAPSSYQVPIAENTATREAGSTSAEPT